ncbi:ATP-binding cassette domain-containing protein [Streptomyces triticagri]|uniref:ATP-binding cassette domain-containing protein n=1 Tax=Streptomyces triticagri TaxID=2293568 RepID=A0A372LWS6_9ACTN|nr:ATP-binding cassette domain-containing protein [Streptomyces triticagri]RFU82745.1 ATP-binding cassette domain-containing protein [Streptomyces triticagri]
MDEVVGPPVLELDGVSCRVPGRDLFAGAELSLGAGESVAVTGASGSGKSTLLMCVLGMAEPAAGTVRVAGADLYGMPERRRVRHRRDHVGMVFQFGELLPELTPVENVALAGLLGGQGRADAYGEAKSLLDELGVPTGSSPATDTLSGGERQRTAVARALINKPSLLLADEPTGSLDQEHRDSVAELLFSLPRSRDCALLLVTHDPAVARRADRQVAIAEGTLLPVAASKDRA